MRQVLTQNGGQSSPTRWSAEPALQSRDVSMQWRRIVWCRCRPIPKYLPAAPEKDCSLCYMFHMNLQYLLFIQQLIFDCVFSWHWCIFLLLYLKLECFPDGGEEDSASFKNIWVKLCIIETKIWYQMIYKTLICSALCIVLKVLKHDMNMKRKIAQKWQKVT